MRVFLCGVAQKTWTTLTKQPRARAHAVARQQAFRNNNHHHFQNQRLALRYLSSYHSVLEVSPGASQDDIKKAYRKMAMKYHPDRNPGNKNAETKFKEASEAYQALSSSGGGSGGGFGFDGGGGGNNHSHDFHAGMNVSREQAEQIFREFEKMFSGGGGFDFGTNSFSQTTFTRDSRGQSVRRIVVINRKPDGTEERQVHEEKVSNGNFGSGFPHAAFRAGNFSNAHGMSEEQLKEMQKQQKVMMKTVTSAIKTAAKEAVKSAFKKKVNNAWKGLLNTFGFDGKKKGLKK